MPTRPQIHRPPGWKPYVSQKIADAYYQSQHWLDLRGRVGKRDRWRCTRCGEPTRTVHHIVHRPRVPEPTEFDVDANCECLCTKCHSGEHPEKGQYDRMKD